MNTFVKINSVNYPAEIYGHVRDTAWDGRESKVIVLALTIQEALDLFVDGLQWAIVYGTQTIPQEDFIIAGPITDNRNGTVSVRMGKANTAEQDALDAQQAAEAQAAKVSQSLVTLAGKPIQESEVSSLRASFENAANKLSDDDAKIAPSLTTAWNMGQQVSTGQRRYYAPDGNLYKALQDHTTSISTSPDTTTDYWVKL